MFILTAEIKAKAGCEQAVEDALLAMIPDVQNEEDTLTYTLHRDTNDPSHFMYYEVYTDEDAFKFHAATPYFGALGQALDGKLDGNPVETFYEFRGKIER